MNTDKQMRGAGMSQNRNQLLTSSSEFRGMHENSGYNTRKILMRCLVDNALNPMLIMTVDVNKFSTTICSAGKYT